MTLTYEQLSEALQTYRAAMALWGDTVNARLRKLEEANAELERRVTSIEKRIRFIDGGIGR